MIKNSTFLMFFTGENWSNINVHYSMFIAFQFTKFVSEHPNALLRASVSITILVMGGISNTYNEIDGFKDDGKIVRF